MSTQIRISQAARLLGVSDDTVRRWIGDGKLTAHGDGPAWIDGAELAAFAQDAAGTASGAAPAQRSARNSFTGLVTKVTSDVVMSQVDLLCGPFRVVALISTEAVRELQLVPGSVATAVVKATNVTIETATL